ncbi:4-hydroxy-tetrahydrodipicolinate synthase [Pontibacillus yanchengensis]|uniref:4-hydroxy-tetrahydrodipicolinate synthase n=2 Tax=Pontibacillus yanchengensis TaxID=462910 RepID=A0ACC7VAV6_9BACI|nr:4-hydroxy-tetrahydrodipicolinate synthase [Pontibacillus yanchengensis]MYL33199.1 4-hydroxy-tetrahydrodipicolinate synthase [Pontibacillus yanchengensis]MYL51951.1 4-hydroxy-tetrahydrodipicolinate synthase [Pontibacillus yanchengensis]
MNFGRVLTAMVTPFDNGGNIDFDKTTKLLQHLIEHGSDGLVVAGTTGESPTLTAEEKIALLNHVVKIVDKRIPVIAGTGSNNTHASIELTKKAEQTGVDGIMLVAPYYNKPTQEGLYQHFSTIAAETKLPVMLYNIPGRSVVTMEVDTIVRLSEIQNIVSVKDAGGDLDAMTEMISKTSDDFSVYSGEDTLTLPSFSIGAAGIVSVSAHVIGNEMQEMLQAVEDGDAAKASKLHQQLLPVMKGCFMAPSPSPVKTALQLKGVDVGGVRLPLLPLTADQRSTLSQLLC